MQPLIEVGRDYALTAHPRHLSDSKLTTQTNLEHHLHKSSVEKNRCRRQGSTGPACSARARTFLRYSTKPRSTSTVCAECLLTMCCFRSARPGQLKSQRRQQYRSATTDESSGNSYSRRRNKASSTAGMLGEQSSKAAARSSLRARHNW